MVVNRALYRDTYNYKHTTIPTFRRLWASKLFQKKLIRSIDLIKKLREGG